MGVIRNPVRSAIVGPVRSPFGDDAVTMFGVEIIGHTLVNLLGVLGRTASTATISVTAGNYYVVTNSLGAQVTVNSTAQATPYKLTGQTSLVLSWASGYTAVYQITAAEYSGALLCPYNYCDSVQFKRDVLLTQKGKNLIPPFTSGEWTLHANAVVNGDYSLTLNATAQYQSSYIDVPINPGTIYTISHGAVVPIKNFGYYRFYSATGNSLTEGTTLVAGISVSSPSNATKLRLYFDANIAGTFTFTNPQLELGSVATTFEPRTVSYAHIPQKIAQDESVWVFGQRAVYKKVWEKDVELVPTLLGIVGVSQEYAGSKRIATDSALFPLAVDGYGICIASNTYPLRYFTGATTPESFYISAGVFRVNISAIYSGWPDGFSPSSVEISAYFYGWKMCASDGGVYVSGTKYWKKLTDGTGITSTLPTATYAGYTPYKLTYKLASPVYYIDRINGSPILSAGSMVSLPRKQMQIEQKTGIVWPGRTDVSPKYNYCVDIGTDVVNPLNTGQDNWSQTFFNENVGLIPDNVAGRV